MQRPGKITMILSHFIESCIPKIKHPSNRKAQVYLNQRAIKLRNEKIAAWRRYRATGSHLDYCYLINVRPLFVGFMFSSGNFQDDMRAGGSLLLPIIHILTFL